MVSLELLFFMMNDTIFFDTIVKSILQFYNHFLNRFPPIQRYIKLSCKINVSKVNDK